MKKSLILLSALALASLYGCGDDGVSANAESSSSAGSSSSTGSTISVYSCDMVTKMEMMGVSVNSHTCGEAAASDVTDADKAQCASMPAFGMTATQGEGCPSGAVLSCSGTKDGKSYTQYYYDDTYKGMTCEQAAAEDEE